MIALQTNTHDFILGLRTDIVNQFELLIDDLHNTLSILAGVLVSIFVVYKVIIYMVNPEKGIDPFVLVRPCLLLAGIALYKDLLEFFMFKPMRFISQIFEESILRLSGTNITGFDAGFNDMMTSVNSNLYDILQISVFFEFLHLLVYFVGSFVASYMLIKQTITIGIYYLMGYLSLIFSLIPGNDKSFMNWSLSFLAILLWEPFILILKYLIILTEIDSSSFTSVFVGVAVQISSIFLFLKVPRFCEFIINGGSPLGSPSAGGSISAMKRISSGIESLGSMLSSKKK